MGKYRIKDRKLGKKINVISALDSELKEVNHLDKKGDREQFVIKLENLKDFVTMAKTEEDMEKVFNDKTMQDILNEYNIK